MYTYDEKEGGYGKEAYTMYTVTSKNAPYKFHVTVNYNGTNSTDAKVAWKRDHITFEDGSNIKWFFWYDKDKKKWHPTYSNGNIRNLNSNDLKLFNDVVSDIWIGFTLALNGIKK